MDLEHFFQEGIAHDMLMAQRHFFVYRTIGEHAHLINEADNSDEHSNLKYLQGLAMDQVIMCLSKAYDRKSRNGKYKVRSLETVIEQDFSKSGHFPYSLEYFEPFSKLQDLVNIPFPNKKISSREEFTEYFKFLLASPIVKAKLDNLKLIRDKYIAHNEDLDTVPEIPEFWVDMVFLMDVAKLIVASFGEVYFNTSYFQYTEVGFNKAHYTILIEFHWLIILVKKVVGEDDFKIWWDME